MGIDISARIDTKRLERKLKRIAEREIAKAAATAATKTARTAQKELVRYTTKTINVRGKDVRAVMKTIRAKPQSSASKRFAVLKVTRTQLRLFQFKAKTKKVKSNRGPRIGATVKVLKSSRRGLVKGAFIATARGQERVFKRKGITRSVSELFGPKVIDIARNRRALKFLRGIVRKRYPVVYRQELKFRLAKATGKL